jgi:agmatine deiminase
MARMLQFTDGWAAAWSSFGTITMSSEQPADPVVQPFMKNLLKVAGFLYLSGISSVVFALDLNRPLPNWMDAGRERADGRPPVVSSRAVPPSDFRIPAEYEPVAAVVIGWAGYTKMLASIAKAASGPGKAEVWAAAGPASISGVPAASYSKINAPIDTVWMRDYGPFGLSGGGKARVGIVDAVYRHYQYRRDDDALPVNLGRIKKIEVFGTPMILDGGNVMVDSKGGLFMTKRTYVWNSSLSQDQVDAALKASFKVKNIYAFEYAGYPGEPADGTGHIDMFMKLLNDHTVLVSVADTEPFKSNAEKAISFFKGKTASDGQPYKIITVKGWEDYGTWYTYTNSLLVNKTAILPSYSGHAKEEAEAKAAYEAGIPGVTVVPVPSDDSIGAGGSIHCVTQTIPALPSGGAGGKDASYTPAAKFEDMSLTRNAWENVAESSAMEQLKDQTAR